MYCELKWSGGWSTGTAGWLSASERGQFLEGWPALNEVRGSTSIPARLDTLVYISWYIKQ